MADHPQASSRRSFLKRAAAAVAALGVMVAAPVWALKTPRQSAASTRSPARSAVPPEPLVAYVRDAARGEIVLLVGSQEVVLTDPGLVSHLARCCEA